MTSEPEKFIYFCPFCFASEDDGSWGETCDATHCANCSMGFGISIPKWAVQRIRQGASWVGKRYYPCDEDREAHAEREKLSELIPDEWLLAHRSAAPCSADLGPNFWTVTQGNTSIFPIQAETAREAILKTRGKLRYTGRPTP